MGRLRVCPFPRRSGVVAKVVGTSVGPFEVKVLVACAAVAAALQGRCAKTTFDNFCAFVLAPCSRFLDKAILLALPATPAIHSSKGSP